MSLLSRMTMIPNLLLMADIVADNYLLHTGHSWLISLPHSLCGVWLRSKCPLMASHPVFGLFDDKRDQLVCDYGFRLFWGLWNSNIAISIARAFSRERQSLWGLHEFTEHTCLFAFV